MDEARRRRLTQCVPDCNGAGMLVSLAAGAGRRLSLICWDDDRMSRAQWLAFVHTEQLRGDSEDFESGDVAELQVAGQWFEDAALSLGAGLVGRMRMLGLRCSSLHSCCFPR